MGYELDVFFTAIFKLYISYHIKIFIFSLRKRQLFKCDCKNQTIQFKVKISSMYHAKSPISRLPSIHSDAYTSLTACKNVRTRLKRCGHIDVSTFGRQTFTHKTMPTDFASKNKGL